MKITDLNSMVQLRKKKPRMKFTEKMQYREHQERQVFSQQVHTREQRLQPQILDGFAINVACRVKMPHLAIRAKLASSNYSDVIEEDLAFFKNLTHLDLSDNCVQMHQLTNLNALEELDLQQNNIRELHLFEDSFPHLHTLHLSFNRIPKDHLFALGTLKSLQVLNLASNNLGSLPMNMSFLETLQEFNLSANNLGNDPSTGPAVFKALSTIPMLRKLNLSRNNFGEFHSDMFPEQNASLPVDAQVFLYLEELYFAFNNVQSEDKLIWPVVQIPTLRYLVITGNPFAMQAGVKATIGTNENAQTLESLLAGKEGQLVNETLLPPSFQRTQPKTPL